MPLDSAGKLGLVLFQFPSWFLLGERQYEYILSCQKHLPHYHLAVEFRHNAWLSEKNRGRTFKFLRENDLAYVCVDEPQGFKSSIPPVIEATSDIGIIRFHWRNRQGWENDNPASSEGFNYLYTAEELEEWQPRIKDLASRTRQLHVIFNNCYGDKAVCNARQIRLLFD